MRAPLNDPAQLSGGGSLLATIAAIARMHPGKAAIVSDAAELSYGELERRASRLAHYLQKRGTGAETLVAVCLQRSSEFVIAALAILKCGAAYLPLDPTNPGERLRFILNDAGAELLVTTTLFARQFSRDIPVIAFDADNFEETPLPQPYPRANDQLAYVIYTSGSTGEPKGVEITQANLANLISWHLRAFDIDDATRATFQAGVGFDAAVWEIWPTLAAGATLYLPDEATKLSPEALRDWLVANRITISFVPTAIAEQLVALRWPGETALRFLLTGADTLHRYPARDLPFQLVNNYGPTECTVVATSGVVPAEQRTCELPSIGRAIDNVQVRILDPQKRDVAAGVTGEIYLGGAGVGRGYRNRAQLTAQHFVTLAGERFYRTGDLARARPNGEISFLGRIDEQVKIRGYRIELNEISAVLKAQPNVRAAVVSAREDTPGDKRLVAHVVPAAGAQPNERSLRDAIRQRLPDYMEPSAFVWLKSLPLTSNGKIDRAALPAPEFTRDEQFLAPQTEIEERLAAIIIDVLKLPRVSVHDDFFHLGAHSLLGAQIVARVRDAFGVELKLLDVFDAPTVAELSQKIEAALMARLNAMSDAEVQAALAAFSG